MSSKYKGLLDRLFTEARVLDIEEANYRDWDFIVETMKLGSAAIEELEEKVKELTNEQRSNLIERLEAAANTSQGQLKDQLLMEEAASALQACEWSYDMGAAPKDGTRILLLIDDVARIGKWYDDDADRGPQPTAWRIITLPEETK